MIFCIELTDDYHMGTAGKVWAFLDTSSDKFLRTECGRHVFNSLEIDEHPRAAELILLVPLDYYTGK